ncbi:MAG: sigma-54-dependent Fis family transcriptional regulator [Bacillota bacterium]
MESLPGDTGSRNLYGAWLRFTSGQTLDAGTVRDVVVASWRRCRDLGVKPDEPTVYRLSDSHLSYRLSRRLEIIEATTPFMKSLYDLVKGSGFVVTLCDEEGFLLEILGDAEVLEDAGNISLVNGVNWSEEYFGTTAIGVTLATGAPVQVCAAEHFCRMCHSWTCSAAPIRDPDGRLLGVLNMSGHCRRAHPHTLGMVVAAAGAIDNQIRAQKISRDLLVTNRYLLALMGSMPDGLVSVDTNGRITHMNMAAGRMLGVDPEKATGRSFPKNIGREIGIPEVLGRNITVLDREVEVDGPAGRAQVSVSARAIWQEAGSAAGCLVTLREMKSVRRLAQRMVGAKAIFTFEDIVGRSGSLSKTVDLARMAAGSSSNVLLEGQSGTGKEMFAQAIHNASPRCRGPFVAINCAALPRDLVGSELFGYTEGAFTGARREGRPGKFELADGGTILLDEIGDMPLDMQVALLRVLEEKTIVRIGGQRVIPVDVRVIASTKKDLKDEVARGHFRDDLYYRLHVLTISIPPLRERVGDVPYLAHHFLERLGEKMDRRGAAFTTEAMRALEAYHWPGNVRELQNVVEQAINLVQGSLIGIAHLMLPRSSEGSQTSLREAEERAIAEALETTGGNVTAAARLLGVSRNTIYRRAGRQRGYGGLRRDERPV